MNNFPKTPEELDDIFGTPLSTEVATGQSTTSAKPKRTAEEVYDSWDDDGPTPSVQATTPFVQDSTNTGSLVNTTLTRAGTPRVRRGSIFFTHDMVELMRTLRKNDYTIAEITAYVRRQPGYTLVTPDMVRQRIERGPSVRAEPRVITDDMVRQICGKD